MAETYIIQNLTTTGSSSPSASLVRLGVIAVATDNTHPALYFLKNDGSFAKIIDEANINGNTITLSGYTTTESGQTVVATDTVDIAIAKLVAEIDSLKARVTELENQSTVTTHSITLNGDSNVSFSNLQKSIFDGSSYTLVVTAATGYEISNVSVTMGGTDISSSAYSNGNVSIASVTGDIIVTVSVALLSYTVSTEGSNVTFDNTTSAITYGSEYTLNITPSTNYEISNVSVTMGGTDISSSAYSNGKVSITSVTGNIVIAVTTAPVNFAVSMIGTGITYGNTATQAAYGSKYEVNITPTGVYGISTVTVTMGGEDVTSSVYSNGKVSIASVTGAIVITVTVTERTIFDIGEVSTTDSANQTAISINDGALSSGTYTMIYEDADNNEIATADNLGALGIIDEFTI